MSESSDSGFSLIEVLVSMVLLLIGVVGLQAALALGVRQLTSSQGQVVAAQRAAEAVESVFKARDNKVLAWAQIRNVVGETGADGGVFLDGALALRQPGTDGLVATADDGDAVQTVTPGLDRVLGTEDDVTRDIVGFTREIRITTVSTTLRRLQVIVQYPVSSGVATYTLTTYISSYA